MKTFFDFQVVLLNLLEKKSSTDFRINLKAFIEYATRSQTDVTNICDDVGHIEHNSPIFLVNLTVSCLHVLDLFVNVCLPYDAIFLQLKTHLSR